MEGEIDFEDVMNYYLGKNEITYEKLLKNTYRLKMEHLYFYMEI